MNRQHARHIWRYHYWLGTVWKGDLMGHYDDVIMGAIASQITSLTSVYSTVYLDADDRKHQSSASLAFVRGIHRGPVNSPHKWPVTRKMFPFDDVIMQCLSWHISNCTDVFAKHMQLLYLLYKLKSWWYLFIYSKKSTWSFPGIILSIWGHG